MSASLPASLPDQPDDLEAVIARKEKEDYPLKRGAEARVVWHDETTKARTPCSIVYLHGFKGSHGEGAPVHQAIARSFGCNLYLSRLHGHGQIKVNKFDDLRPGHLLHSAEEACRIGRAIGEKVILMGTSTGAALSLYLAGLSEQRTAIQGLVLYSPLIRLYGIHALLLQNRWMRSLLSHVPGRNYQVRPSDPFTPDEQHIWYQAYKLNGALTLGETIQSFMRPPVFRSVTCPAFIGYYFKDEAHHDKVVSVPAIKRMARQLGTPADDRVVQNFPAANSHVICNGLLSADVAGVIRETKAFLKQKVGLEPADKD